MGLRERIADPWGALVAAVAGGLAWAVVPGGPVAVGVGLGVAAAVFGAKVLGETLLGRARTAAPGPAPAGPAELPEPPRGTAARAWRDRAERALAAWDATVAAAGAGATRDQLRALGERAAGTAAAARRIAGQAAAFEQAAARIPAAALTEERARLRASLRHADGVVRAERAAALASVEEQLAVHARLAAARETALARLQASALGLESLHARAVELLALAAATGDTPAGEAVDGLAAELEGLRQGLVEAERLGRPDLPG